MSPDVILLNGTSSSGKTTLSRALQRQAGIPLLHVSLVTSMESPESGAAKILAHIRAGTARS